MNDPLLETNVSKPGPSGWSIGLRNLFSNLPEILMIGLTIWVTDLAAIFSVAGILHAGLILMTVVATIFVLPALWASWHTLRLAVHPPMTDSTLPD